MAWHTVDEAGHIPGVAAELPPGARVLLDAAGNIGAIEAPLLPPPSEQSSEQEQASTAGEEIKEESHG